MNTEIITSILGIEIAFVIGFALPRLCAKIMMKAIGVTEDDYKFSFNFLFTSTESINLHAVIEV